MTRKRKLLSLGVIGAVFALTAGTLTAVALAASPSKAAAQYSAPFVCGFTWADQSPSVEPGNYATAINIHNYTNSPNFIGGSNRVDLQYSMGEPVPPSIPFYNFRISKGRVLEIDCNDIWAMVGVPPDTFLKGALHIGLTTELPMAAIYTSQTDIDPTPGFPSDPGAGTSIDIEHILPLGGAAGN